MIDWEAAVKPLLGGASSQFQPKDLIAIVDAIIKNKDSIFEHDSSHECFYAMFMFLSGYLLSSFEELVKLENLNKVGEACQIVLEFCMNLVVNFDQSYLCAPKHIMVIMMSLCGKCDYPKENIITFIAMIKSAQVPMTVKLSTEGESVNPVSSSTNAELSVDDMFKFLASDFKMELAEGTTAFTQLCERNTKQLLLLSNKFGLFKSFLKLPYLARYVNRHTRAYEAFKTGSNKQLVLPLSVNDALAVKNGLQLLQNNLKLVSDATLAPSLLEPCTEEQALSNCDVALSCLCTGISVGVAMTVLDHDKEKNVDLQQSREIEMIESASNSVKDSNHVHTMIRNSLKKNENATLLNNYDLVSVCYLLKGLQYAIDVPRSNEQTGKPTSKKTSHFLMMTLVGSLITQLSDLLSQHSNYSPAQQGDEKYLISSLLQTLDPEKRCLIITKKFNIIELLLTWVFDCFSLLENAKNVPTTPTANPKAPRSGTDSGGTSDEGEEFGYYDISSSQDSDVSSSDSSYYEPGSLLGAWMIKLMSTDAEEKEDKPEDIVPEAQLPSLEGPYKTSKSKSPKVEKSPNEIANLQIVSEEMIMEHCSKILHLLITHFLKSGNRATQDYFVKKLDDKMLGKLSEMLLMLDHEGRKPGKEGLALMELIQKLLSSDAFDDSRKTEIGNLVLSKSLQHSNALLLGPFAMTIQTQILIQRQQHAIKMGENDQSAVEFVSSLVKYYENDNEVGFGNDINVEVFQLCLFLFHTFNDGGKKRFLLQVVNGVINTSNKATIPRTRLIILLEYLFHYYAVPSQDILEQVKWNFFNSSIFTMDNEKSLSSQEKYDSAKKFILFGQNDDSEKTPNQNQSAFNVFFSFPAGKEKSKKEALPRQQQNLFSSFYFELVSEKNRNDSTWTNNSEAFQIILKDEELYDKLFNAFALNLSLFTKIENTNSNEDKIAEVALENQSSEYNFKISWRFASELPPPNSFISKIDDCNLNHTGEVLLAVNSKLTSKVSDRTPTDTSATSEMWKGGEEKSTGGEILDENLQKLVKITDMNLRKIIVGKSGIQPSLIELMTVDCCLAHLKDNLWMIIVTQTKRTSEGGGTVNDPVFNDLLQTVLDAIATHAAMCRSHIVEMALRNDSGDSCKNCSAESLCELLKVSNISGESSSRSVEIPLPFAIGRVHSSWSAEHKRIAELKKNASETGGKIKQTIDFYLKVLSEGDCSGDKIKETFISDLLILIQHSLLLIFEDLVLMQDLPQEEIDSVIAPLLTDAVFQDSLDTIHDMSFFHELHGEKEEVFNFYALKAVYELLVNHFDPATGLNCDLVATRLIKFLEESSFNPSMRRAMCKFFVPESVLEKETSSDLLFKGKVSNYKGDITKLLLSNKQISSPKYSQQLLQFIATLCKTAMKADEIPALLICNELCSLKLDPAEMRDWVGRFEQDVVTSSGKKDDNDALLTLADFIVKEQGSFLAPKSSGDLASSLLDAVLPPESSSGGDVAMATLLSISPGFVVILATLANAHGGSGHPKVLSHAVRWLDAATALVSNEESLEKIHSQNQNEITRAMSTCSHLLLYIGDVLTAFTNAEDNTRDLDTFSSSSSESESEESSQEEEEREQKEGEEEGLWSKLCTYTVTQKKFMNQHWYQCHTCDMTDGVGVCTICAKVCHKNHDLVYAKYGSFFCDCGAKENKSCKALVKRVPGSDNVVSGVSAFSDTRPTTTSASATSTSIEPSTSTSKASINNKEKSSENETAAIAAERLIKMVTKKAKSILKRETTLIGKPIVITTNSRAELVELIGGEGEISIISSLLKFLNAMKDVVDSDEYKLNSASSTRRALNAISSLHNTDKQVAVVSNLMVPTLGSQEGAFENVKANYTGDQAQTIRQLITSKSIRRVAMCCLSTMTGRKQHLAVSHEKGKVTLLQLSALLKQTDTTKRKLTLTRLSTTAMPFPVTTISANPCNEEVLAVCGLKDCHVLIFSSSSNTSIQSGTVSQHLVLHPQLATSNYIVKAKWLPASPSILALITADFIKIYDLAKDVLSPIYYLLLPTGKIQDVTIICGVEGPVDTCVIVMSSTGHIYSQLLNDESLAVHGTFYMTNILNVKSDLLKEVGGKIGGEGVSCFYSHSLKLLFMSYGNGHNFAASLDKKMENVQKLFPIQYKPGNGTGSTRNTALHEWSEVLNHPGLITCFSHSNGCPVVVMIEPEKIMIQEIKVTSTKSKVIDLVAVRHGSPSSANEDDRTTVIVLCEDGSLRIYLAFADTTRYWLQPNLLPTNILGHSKRYKKSSGKANKENAEKEESGFPIDFFEHCQLFNSTDIEFGGQLLEVYNVAQIKNRLNTAGMYVMAIRGFTIEIINKNSNMVITGLRILLGTQGGTACPTHLMIDERYICLGPRVTKPRWFDIPLTREESINFHDKLKLFCGVSEHPDDHNMVDNIKVYGKTKETFGWPQDGPVIGSKSEKKEKAPKLGSASDNESEDSTATEVNKSLEINSGIADDALLSCLFAINCSFHDFLRNNIDQDLRTQALNLTSDLLVQPLTLRGHSTVKQVIMRLFNDRNDSYKFQDGQLLKHAAKLLEIDQSGEVPVERAPIDEEGFQRILSQLSHIARQRPSNLAIARNGNTEEDGVKIIDLESENDEEMKENVSEIAKKISFHEKVLRGMMTSFWRLLSRKPKSRLLTPPSLPGLTHVEVTVKVMVDIVHAISAHLPDTQNMAVEIYFDLLTFGDFHVTFAARSALCRLLQSPHADTRQSDDCLDKGRSSKMSDTPASSRSETPPSVTSNQTTTTATFPPQPQQQLRPGSHLSSHGTQGETLDDEEDEEDDDDDDFEDLGNDDMAISLDNHVLNETYNMEAQNAINQENPDFYHEILPEDMDEAARDYIRLLASSQQGAAQNNEGGQPVTAEFLQALGTSLPSEDSFDDPQAIENLLSGIDLEQLLPPNPEDDEAMVEYAIALSLQQQERQDQQTDRQQLQLRLQRRQARSQQRQELREQAQLVARQDVVDQQEIVAQQAEESQLDQDIERNILLQQRNELRQQIQQLQQQNDNLDMQHLEQQRNSDPADVTIGESDVDEQSLSEGEKEEEKMKQEGEKSNKEKESPKKKRASDTISEDKLQGLRFLILSKIFSRVQEVEGLGGERSIPFFQVVSMLVSALDFTNDAHVALHRHIVVTIIERVKSVCFDNEDKDDSEKIHQQTPKHEVFVIMMRLLSVMMSKSHFPNQSNKSDPASPTTIYRRTAGILVQENMLQLCHFLLRTLYTKKWEQPLVRQPSATETMDSTPSGLLQVASKHTSVNMTPFFMPQYVQSSSGALFHPYLRLITEMALNMAAQVMKQNPGTKFGPEWRLLLSDYMLYGEVPSPVRRRVRKLLFRITGSKEKYREERDLHAHSNYFETCVGLCRWDEEDSKPPNLTYDELISLSAVIRVCCEIAEKRTRNWQKYCVQNPRFLPFLLDMCVNTEEEVSSNTLTLLLCAIPAPQSEDKAKKAAKSENGTVKGDDVLSCKIAHRMMADISDSSLEDFVKHFLLEMNVTTIRWSAHSFILNLFRNSNEDSQRRLLKILWSLCPLTPLYGRKAAQFIDILGYLSMKPGLSKEQAEEVTASTLKVLQHQNQLLSNHQNAILYSQLANYVQFDGFYLENNPCLVCNQPEVPFTNIKLSTIKSDTKYTTTQQIIKLIGSYMVKKMTIRVTDIKRTKMIRTAVLYYNNKKVPAIVDLKNNPSMWHKARTVSVPQGETEITIKLSLPVVATNLMLEFTDFYENVSASIETLQCPRCSASVQANPGICGNCGENVFQCHKCRSINYDEKDPYLCNVCGFSKYAKFDVLVKARSCCAVDSIENDEDRKKMVAYVVRLLDKADTVYNQLNAHKPQLEALLAQISKMSADVTVLIPNNPTTQPKRKPPLQQRTPQPGLSIAPSHVPNIVLGGGGNAPVSSNIQQLAKKYCQDCKTLFDELSGIMRTVLASRSEIVEYDKRQQSAATSGQSTDTKPRHVPTSSATWCQSAPDCYGCASASAQQAVTLLRVLATHERAKAVLVDRGTVRELAVFNLRRGTGKARKQVHSLIGQLVKNNSAATSQLNELLYSRITGAIRHHGDNLLPSAINCEMQLLMSMLEIRDDLWQSRLKNAMKLFQNVVKIKSPAVVENVTLPCIQMIRKLVSPEGKTNQQADGKVSVDATKWLEAEDKSNHYEAWRKMRGRIGAPAQKKEQKADKTKVHETYLEEKYAQKWKDFVLKKKNQAPRKLSLSNNHFLRTMLFSPSSRSVRQAACAVVTSLARNTSRKPQVLTLLTSYLDELGNAGEAATEFLALYQEQIRPKQWRVFLAANGVLPLIGNLIQKEIAKLSVLEETTLNLNLQQGFALKELTELLSELVQVSYVRQHYKGKLVGTVLNSYLSLRRLVIQRTNLVDDAQDILLDLLEELTTGTESETRSFMEVCIEVIKKQDPNDMKTPQFIFERLANIIYHEENDTSEFFLSLDKDPLQEDFLQGRMVGNPYSSNEPGLGPLMRDVKNKICRDCDLIALLEDDSGMELLINNKIIALDLPVRDVYKKIWLPNHNEEDSMHVVYRMRGLLGEATEDIVERLDSDKADQNDEEVYKLASVLSRSGGNEVILSRLESVKSLAHGHQLVDVILKLLSYSVKLKVNRHYLAKPKLNTLNTLLGTLNLGLQAGEEGVAIVEQLLEIMGSILLEASSDKEESGSREEQSGSREEQSGSREEQSGSKEEEVVSTGDKKKLTLLLQQIDSEFVQSHTNILQGLLRIIPYLSFGDSDLMQMLIDHFIGFLDFDKYDESHTDEDKIYLNCFCEIVSGIQFNESGNQLKRLMLGNGILKVAMDYLTKHTPDHKNFDSEDWKTLVSKPGLPFCLRMLTGLCTKHTETQELVGKAIPQLHKLEQISTEEGIGGLAENVLKSLQGDTTVALKVKEVREQTRLEKKKLAMEVRQQQLGALGMHTNEKGQVISKSNILQQISELIEESGLTCIICREGYKFEPKKVLGVYTYTRRCALEEFENKPRQQQGHSTVSHFNVVHYDCHTAAVRMARGREEWESALLQNASTKCNGLLPLWGAKVPEASFASCLARHNTYIQEATGQREPNFHSNVHDLKLLLLRFAEEKSFSVESGGGGRQSNINLIPYIIHMGLYTINSSRSQAREERLITEFVSSSTFTSKWVESSYEVEGPLFMTSLSCFVINREKWNQEKGKFLKRLLVLAQARNQSKTTISSLTEKSALPYAVYKPFLMFWALADSIINILFKATSESGDCSELATYIRHNDNQLLENGEKMLHKFQDELLPCESLDEFVDVMGCYDIVDNDVSAFMTRLFQPPA